MYEEEEIMFEFLTRENKLKLENFYKLRIFLQYYKNDTNLNLENYDVEQKDKSESEFD